MPRTKRPVEVTTEQTPSPAGHNSQITDDSLIAENHKITDLIKAAQARFDEWAAPHKARQKEIEDALFARLVERGADSTKTDSGTAYISHLASVKIEDAEKLFDFAAEHWDACGNEIKLSIGIKAVRTWMDEHDGQLPPGISLSKYSRLNINRS
jgi:methionyl-tRNA synthetase